MKTLFSEDYLECSFDEDHKILFHAWKRKPTGDEFRNGLMKVYDHYIAHRKIHPILHWLGDTRLMGVLALAEQTWLDQVWNELLFVKAGAKTHAVILGNDTFAKYAMEKFKKSMLAKYAEQNLHIETFVDQASAYAWFKEAEKDLK
jgi:hypothetical protein